MKKLLLLSALAVYPLVSFTQVALDWNLQHTGNGTHVGASVVVDPFGDVISVGTFTDTFFFAGSSTPIVASSYQDTYILKTDSYGNTIWSRTFGGNFAEVVRAVDTDTAGNIYYTGHCKGTIDFDPGPGTDILSTQGQTDAFVVKLDSAGNYQWARLIGGAGYERSFSLSTDNYGDVYVIGYFSSTVDFDPGPGVANRTSAGDYDGFVVKFKTNGDFDWVNTYGGAGRDEMQTVTNDSQNNCLIGGYFEGTADLDPGAGTLSFVSAGADDFFFQKLDSSGAVIWNNVIGDSLGQVIRAIAVDDNDDIYISGVFSGTVDFDPGPGTAYRTYFGGVDLFLAKYQGDGSYVWSTGYGGPYYERGRSIATDSDGYVYLTGEYSGAVIFDPGGEDVIFITDTVATNYLLKMTQDGEFQWVRSIGGDGVESSAWVAAGGNGDVYFTGSFDDTVDFDFNSGVAEFYAVGPSDAFLCKLVQCGDTTIVMPGGMTLQANAPSAATYQWLDCDNNYAAIPGETNQTFTATVPGNYALVTTMYSCTDTSACYHLDDTGLSELDGSGLLIYPNPTSGMLSIEATGSVPVTNVEVIDLNGRQILHEEVNGFFVQTRIDAGAGTYIVLVRLDDQSVRTRRVVVY